MACRASGCVHIRLYPAQAMLARWPKTVSRNESRGAVECEPAFPYRCSACPPKARWGPSTGRGLGAQCSPHRSQSGCRHFMVKHLHTGGFLIPGHSTVHPSLASLVAFHQQQPLRPHQELLTQACGQVRGTGGSPGPCRARPTRGRPTPVGGACFRIRPVGGA